MSTLLSPHFELEDVTQEDLIIASLAWGFTLGFGWLTTWTAVRQSTSIWRRYSTHSVHNTYIWLIWLEILVCLVFGIICWLYLLGYIAPSFAFYFSILTTWALQVQFLLQIIINRCALLIPDRHRVRRLKFGVALLITAINISVYNIWIPARLQISERYIWINEWWDRCEKVIYLLVDGALNVYFVAIVKKTLISNGLVKYKRLTQFNIFIICFSLSMDVLIISMMSLKNTFVYMQFHPLAYMVKLKIEMSMADLIAKVAKTKEPRHRNSRQPLAATSTRHNKNNSSNHSQQQQRARGLLHSLSSPLRSALTTATTTIITTTTNSNSTQHTIQPLPPARNAVPFKLWSVTDESGGGGGGSGGGVADPMTLQRQQEERELYMLQEVTVELRLPEMQEEEDYDEIHRIIPAIWDGSGYLSSTVTSAGRRGSEC